MVVLNGIIANRMSLTLASFVRSTSGRTMAGEGIEGAVGSIRDLEGRGCLATVGVLGEFGDAWITGLRSGSPNSVSRRMRVWTHRRADVTLPARYSDEVLQKESRCKTCTLMNAIA
jgi:hypothetical protein